MTRVLRNASELAVDGRGFAGMVGSSGPMQQLFRAVRRVARSDVSVLVLGESGVGKELVARALHDHSDRSNGPFVALNCAAIPQELQESELFGHERGSFTGASAAHRGRFEEADGGTLFLDEIGELSPGLQAKLLRVLQDGTYRRVGATADQMSDFRLVSATHKRLYDRAAAGAFRQDLYYRLAVFELETPPLRARGDDVMILAHTFAAEFCRAMELPSCSFSAGARRILRAHDWPGNVRELRNAMQYAVMLSGGGTVHADHLPERLTDGGVRRRDADLSLPAVPWQELERMAIDQALERTEGRMVEAAELLGINRTTLYRKLRKHRLAAQPE